MAPQFPSDPQLRALYEAQMPEQNPMEKQHRSRRRSSITHSQASMYQAYSDMRLNNGYDMPSPKQQRKFSHRHRLSADAPHTMY
jgi:hypothetical protein